MKNRLLIILSFIWIMLIFIGCYKTTPKQKVHNVLNNEQKLLNILSNEITFIGEDQESYLLQDYKLSKNKNIETIPDKYVLIDLNGDSSKELILHVTPNYGAYLIFYIENEKIYSFELTERQVIDLKVDGTFIQSAGSGINSYNKIKFEKTYEIIEEAYKNDYDKIYKINGKSTTEEKIIEYVNNFKSKSGVAWTEVSN